MCNSRNTIWLIMYLYNETWNKYLIDCGSGTIVFILVHTPVLAHVIVHILKCTHTNIYTCTCKRMYLYLDIKHKNTIKIIKTVASGGGKGNQSCSWMGEKGENRVSHICFNQLFAIKKSKHVCLSMSVSVSMSVLKSVSMPVSKSMSISIPEHVHTGDALRRNTRNTIYYLNF
jgi:hypothetical protein